MNQPAEPQIGAPLALFILTAFCASLALWGWIARRVLRRQPVIPWQARRPVPWQAVDLLTIVVAHFFFAGAVVDLDRILFPEVAALAAQPSDGDQPTTEHDVLVLLREERSPTALFVCFLAAVVVAPITEEVLFRLLFQGWLERAERSCRGSFRMGRGWMRGWVPVLGSSSAFAVLHSRTASLPPNPRVIFHALVCDTLVKLATTAFAVVWVRWRARATWEDLGFQRGALRRDVVLGLGAALAVIPWIYVLQGTLTELLPADFSPDPFTLTPFAMVLGLLYYRTHRIAPPIVLHLALNAASLALAWAVL